jgi:hypothetical protein
MFWPKVDLPREKKTYFYVKHIFFCTVIDNNAQILALVIHQCDKLRTDVNIYHPMVRVHLLDLDSDGRYVKKSIKLVFDFFMHLLFLHCS